MQTVWQEDPGPGRLGGWSRRAQALLAQPPGSHDAASLGRGSLMAALRPCEPEAPDLGDLVIVLLASTLAGLRDRLEHDGFHRASELVADLVEITDDHLCRLDERCRPPESGTR